MIQPFSFRFLAVLAVLGVLVVSLSACSDELSCEDGDPVKLADIDGLWQVTESGYSTHPVGEVLELNGPVAYWHSADGTAMEYAPEMRGNRQLAMVSTRAQYEDIYCVTHEGEQLTLIIPVSGYTFKLKRIEQLPAEMR